MKVSSEYAELNEDTRRPEAARVLSALCQQHGLHHEGKRYFSVKFVYGCVVPPCWLVCWSAIDPFFH